MEEADEWIKKSEHDLYAADVNLQQKLYDVSAFLSHQAAEKALKALYIRKFKRLWKIHELFTLGEKVGAPKIMLNICEKLNQHYLATRYPTEIKYTRGIAEEALEDAKKAIEWSKEALKQKK